LFYSTHNDSPSKINTNELIAQLPDIIKSDEALLRELLQIINDINTALSNVDVLDQKQEKMFMNKIFALLYKLGVDKSIAGKLLTDVKLEEIVINGVTIDDFYMQA
jgi:hypothetical protein